MSEKGDNIIMNASNPVTVDRDLLQNSLSVIGEWLEEIDYQIYDRGMLDAEAEAEWQASRRRADDVFDRLSSVVNP